METLEEREEKVRLRQENLAQRSLDAPLDPCGRCGTRADVGCKHRPPMGPRPIAIARAQDPEHDGRRRRDYTMQGWNFHRRKGDQ